MITIITKINYLGAFSFPPNQDLMSDFSFDIVLLGNSFFLNGVVSFFKNGVDALRIACIGRSEMDEMEIGDRIGSPSPISDLRISGSPAGRPVSTF